MKMRIFTTHIIFQNITLIFILRKLPPRTLYDWDLKETKLLPTENILLLDLKIAQTFAGILLEYKI